MKKAVIGKGFSGQDMTNGFRILPGYFDRAAQETLLQAVRDLVRRAPFYQPTMPKSGKPTSVKMTNAGPLGWVTDKDRGYRYQALHPVTGNPWPPIPDAVLELWRKESGYSAPPEACLVNWYHSEKSRLGLHIDQDEDASDAPVVSISLGATCLFRLGGPNRRDRTSSTRLSSGDVVVLGGASRHFFHGVDRVFPETSTLMPSPQRINLTLRRVTRPD